MQDSRSGVFEVGVYDGKTDLRADPQPAGHTPRAVRISPVSGDSGKRQKRRLIFGGAALLAAVCAAMAAMLWPDQPGASTMPAPVADVLSVIPPQSPVIAANKPAAHTERRTATAAPLPKTASVEELPLLPVQFIIWDRGPKKIKGNVRNMSSDTLLINIRAVNAQTHRASEAYMSLGPNELKPFSNDDLEMDEQDTVTFHNPQYQDQTTLVQ